MSPLQSRLLISNIHNRAPTPESLRRMHCKNTAMPRHATVTAACAAAVDTPLDRLAWLWLGFGLALAWLAHVFACLLAGCRHRAQFQSADGHCCDAHVCRSRGDRPARWVGGWYCWSVYCRTHGGQCQTLIRPLAHSGHHRMTHMRCKSSRAHALQSARSSQQAACTLYV